MNTVIRVSEMKRKIFQSSIIAAVLFSMGFAAYALDAPQRSNHIGSCCAYVFAEQSNGIFIQTEPTARDLLLMDQLAYYSLHKSEIKKGLTVRDHAEQAMGRLKYESEKYYLMQEILENPKYTSWTIDISTNQNRTNGLRAIAVGTGGGHGIVAYAGTEGWVDEGANLTDMIDNVNMTKAQPTKQQIAALSFLEDASRMYSAIYVSGHSKGGNNAIFAALMVDREIADAICSIVTYNSPGFNHELIQGFSNLDLLNDRITQYCTPDDLVNMMLENADIGEKVYVKSTETNIGKTHSLHSFMFDGENIVPASAE